MKVEYPKDDKGFTLIELLVSMTVIAILVGLALVSFVGVRKTARDGKRKADLEQIRAALEMYRSDAGSYPGTLTFGGSLTYGGDTYMALIPNDPVSSYSYRYKQLTLNSYVLCAYLETGPLASSCSGDWGQCGAEVCNYKTCSP